jgi:exodeoxyribonuclease V alpha subunit
MHSQGPQLNADQQRAVELAINNQIMVLTGGPGTGKTTTCHQILAQLEALGGCIACAAPTGKASKRLQEQTGRPASTIHRLLCWSPQEGRFTVDNESPLDANAVLLDEVSMVDTALMHALLVALRAGTKLVLVGDVDQLPSIGPGNVLRDIIESGVVPVARLSQVYRQSENSWIRVNAQRINAGEPIHTDNASSEDFFFIEHDDPKRAADTIVELVTKTIPEQHGLDSLKDIQVLCPQRRGPVGVHVFNDELQATLNPPALRKPEWRSRGGATFREGDKVIHIKNNYNLGVYNGEVGIIDTIGKEFLSVDFDDRVVVYDRTDVTQLQLCYASTIHKSQGSEFPCVVVPVHSTNAFMLSRPLLYTAVTRGQRFVYLVGDRKGLKRAIKNDEVIKRHTSLDERLAAWCRDQQRRLAEARTDNGAGL